MNGRKRNQELNGGAPLGWKPVSPLPMTDAAQSPAGDIPVVNAIVSTWHDADIIEASVRHLAARGVSRIVILDNDSPDDTVAVAEAAGATVGLRYTTEVYDDDLRIQLQNGVIKDSVEQSALPDCWWIALDADEFPELPGGQSFPEALRGLPRDVRCWGLDAIDLYPTGDCQYVRGKHPAECMAYGMWRRGGMGKYCPAGHWKHNAIRYFDGQFDLAFGRGNHAVMAPGAVSIREAGAGGVMFHAPIRAKDDAYARLQALCSTGRTRWDDQVTGNNGAVKRWKSLEDIFAGRWDRVALPHSQMFGRHVVGLALYPWKRLWRAGESTA